MAAQALFSHTQTVKCCASTKAPPSTQIFPGATSNGADVSQILFLDTMPSLRGIGAWEGVGMAVQALFSGLGLGLGATFVKAFLAYLGVPTLFQVLKRGTPTFSNTPDTFAYSDL